MIPDLLKRNLNWIKELNPQRGAELELIFNTHSFKISNQDLNLLHYNPTVFKCVLFKCVHCDLIISATLSLEKNPWVDLKPTTVPLLYGEILTCTETIIKDIIK